MTDPNTFSLPRLALLLATSLCLTGCFNSSDDEMTLNLGSVSVGQQLMDLETARSAGLLSDAEHRMIRDKLVRTIVALNNDDDHALERHRNGKDADDAADDEEGFTWF